MSSRIVITCGAAGSDYPGFTHLAIQAAVENQHRQAVKCF